ncbi:hypothetical protein WSM22_26410 [Cytophagales bacterium WSM2-2]|nr:hypothetical protein WSM22_26410 [Cytophagales bacterium WSM2-2]
MEHEKKIQDKIRNLELTPIRWNKQEAWAAVRKETKAAPRRLYYYAAAVLILALALTFSLQWKTTERKETSQAYQVKQEKENDKEEIQKPMEEVRTPQLKQEKIFTKPEITKSDRILPLQTLAPLFIRQRDSVILNLENPVAYQKPDTLSLQNAEAQVSPVEPVIGVYSPKEENNARRAEKKLRIKLFSLPEERYANNVPVPSTPTLSVRIN